MREQIKIQSLKLQVGAGSCWYLPDFWIPHTGTLIEVKGAFVYEDARVKFRAAALAYPCFKWVWAQWKEGKWTEQLH